MADRRASFHFDIRLLVSNVRRRRPDIVGDGESNEVVSKLEQAAARTH